ncbi:hypothetical protein ACHHYP_07406 [Achlya hypogyna]|uniref:Domain of unknown function at the cortex 1 domain-containing protein n=1 Tax=Achlya hypogyna TaxID=1202772 RepID=A0A1V9ZM80_ACHHY|nr:hypothetical protein ACHHYP_07406 [Achlya hypogyna]
MVQKPWHAPSLNIYDMILPCGKFAELQRGQRIKPNAGKPYEFENAFFKGKILFLLKTEHEPPKWRSLFTGSHRLFWIQLQGQFKKEPKGPVYIGGEVADRLQFGLLSTSFCRVILSLATLRLAGLRYCFGQNCLNDAGTTTLKEPAHISFPLHTAVDEFHCTPPGQTPPQLGQESFGETDAGRSMRAAVQGRYPFNTRDTYTFSFYSFYIDFERWRLVNVPGVPEMPMERFWASLPMRIVAYSISSATEMSTAVPHTQDDKEYYMSLELSPTKFSAP